MLSKAFTKEQDGAEEGELELEPEAAQPKGVKNYITPAGYARMKAELKQLLDVERPEGVGVVHWAASRRLIRKRMRRSISRRRFLP